MSDSYMDDQASAAGDLQRRVPAEDDMRDPGLPDVDASDPDIFAAGFDDESQDPRRRAPGPAIEFPHPEVPDEPHLGPTIGLGPDDLLPYTHDERGNH